MNIALTVHIPLITDEGSEPSNQALNAMEPYMLAKSAKVDCTGNSIRLGESLLVLSHEKGLQGTHYTQHDWE